MEIGVFWTLMATFDRLSPGSGPKENQFLRFRMAGVPAASGHFAVTTMDSDSICETSKQDQELRKYKNDSIQSKKIQF